MPFLDHIPALIRLTVVFALVLFAIYKKLSLGNAFILGAVILGLVFNQSPLAIIRSILAALSDAKTISLAIIVSLILVFSKIMESAGQMQRLLASFRGLVKSPRLNLVIFPALIGLLPMPGGAVFSAPMVKELGGASKLSAAQLSFINYWFRHLWEYWWPMYPGILLGTLMADLNLVLFMACLCPLTAAAFYFGSRQVRAAFARNQIQTSAKRPSLKPFVIELMPILITIVPGLGLGLLLAELWPGLVIAKETGLILALMAAIAWLWWINKFTAHGMKKIVANLDTLKMAYMILGILIFKGVLTDSRAVLAMADELSSLRIPLILIVICLPFIVGLITGVTIAFVGSTFPIIIPLIQTQGHAEHMLAFIMLALVCGFAGVLLSPLHLCLILSNQYFSAPTAQVYRLTWRPALYLMGTSVVYFWFLWMIARIF